MANTYVYNIVLGPNAGTKPSIPVSVPRIVKPEVAQYDVLDAKMFAAANPTKGIEVSLDQLEDMQANTNLNALIAAGLLTVTQGPVSGIGAIAGIITRSTDNSPLIGATGRLFTVANPPVSTELTGTTTEGGALLISSVPAGAYLLKLSCNGHADLLLPVFVESNKITNVIKQLLPIVPM